MKGEDKKLMQLFEGGEKRFIIPLYQRNYDWEIKHCRQLFADLVKLHEEKRKSHFFGSIVSARVNDYDEDCLIIDGQQRITTISILLIALVNAAKAGDIICNDPRKIDMIYETYLVAKYLENDRKVKLKPIKNDMQSFDALIEGKPEKFNANSNVTVNYNFFYDLLKHCGLSLEDILDAIKRLVVIDIRLASDDDPQLIFESLNSTGLGLSEADKIRNYLLMSMEEEQQEHCYDEYWSKIEEYTANAPTMFVRDYLTLYTKTICNIDNLYFEFKSFVENKQISREEVLSDMTLYARYYYIFSQCKSDDERLNTKFRQLGTIGSTVGMTFYMTFLKYATDNNFSAQQIYDVFDVIEGYWARRIICNLPANAMNKAFAVLHHDVLRLINEEIKRGLQPSPYIEVLKYVLLKRQGTGIYPMDTMLSEEFKTRQIYRIPIDYKYFLFERMENMDNVEGKWENIVPHMRKNDYTIEHIMPQTLSATWRQQLGEDAERIHEQYLHTFANLTLTGYNSSYGNRPFSEKKSGYEHKGKHIYGFDESKFSLSSYLKHIDQWTENEILERQKQLYERFLLLWPMIQTNFKPVEKETDAVSFDDDDIELTNRKIAAFSFKGERHKVTTWKDMLVQLCHEIYLDSPSSMRVLCNEDYWVHEESSPERSQFADGCFVHSSCSTATKKSIIQYLFNKLNISFADLEFELVPLSETENDNQED